MLARFAAIICVVMAIAGCASVPMADTASDASLKQFSTHPDAAGVYVYCNEYMGIHRTNVRIDEQPLGQNTSYTYLYAELAPGRHRVSVEAENTDVLEFDALAGGNYYVWQEKKMGWFSPRVKLQLVSESEGRKGVASARLALSTYNDADQSGARAASAAGTLGSAFLGILLQILAAPVLLLH